MKKTILLLSAMALLSCEQKHSDEYNKAMEEYNKAKIESDKADSAYIQAVKEYYDNSAK